jgi:hypothetical protein
MNENDIRIGMLVNYHSMIGGPVTKEECVVESEPWQLGCGEWVVSINGVRGGVSLDALTKYKGKMTKKVQIDIELDEDGFAILELFVEGKLLGSESIGGEPEDNSYYRDYNWIGTLMKQLAIELGADVKMNVTDKIEN